MSSPIFKLFGVPDIKKYDYAGENYGKTRLYNAVNS